MNLINIKEDLIEHKKTQYHIEKNTYSIFFINEARFFQSS